MLHHIRGTLTRINPLALEVVIEAAGMGFLLRVPRQTFDALPEPGADTALFVHLHFSANSPASAFHLFGFRTEVERSVFRLLLGVDRVGPAQSLAVMSGCDTATLVATVRDGNVSFLKSFKGVGDKMARRIVNELAKEFEKVAAQLPAAPAGRSKAVADAAAILISLGLSQADADTRIQAALKALGPDAAAEELVRHCLAP